MVVMVWALLHRCRYGCFQYKLRQPSAERPSAESLRSSSRSRHCALRQHSGIAMHATRIWSGFPHQVLSATDGRHRVQRGLRLRVCSCSFVVSIARADSLSTSMLVVSEEEAGRRTARCRRRWRWYQAISPVFSGIRGHNWSIGAVQVHGGMVGLLEDARRRSFFQRRPKQPEQ